LMKMGDRKVLFEKDEPYFVFFHAIHHDPY